jgi:hypothetical protein
VPEFFGPTPYLSPGDRPFTVAAAQFEDFEDGALNTLGVTASTFSIASSFGPGLIDSVDVDDGTLDGTCQPGCDDLWANGSVTFTFDAAALGGLPTHVGLVCQHSMMLTARPPRAVSLYLLDMSAPVSRMVLMTLSSETLWLPSPAARARGVDGLDRAHGVALDARHLHQAADRIAGEAEVVLHADLGGVLDLLRGAAQDLARGRRRPSSTRRRPRPGSPPRRPRSTRWSCRACRSRPAVRRNRTRALVVGVGDEADGSTAAPPG